jgi:hypothetical protein
MSFGYVVGVMSLQYYYYYLLSEAALYSVAS